MSDYGENLIPILEAAIFASEEPLTVQKMQQLFTEPFEPSVEQIKSALSDLQQACAERGVELVEVASGYRFQAKQVYANWLQKLWEKKPPRYSRAILETLALIAYRQPITRAEIEEVRGVSVSPDIVKRLMDREWIKIVGHRDVPGKPALLGTTKKFLDYFNLKKLTDLPPLEEIKDLEQIGDSLGMQLSLGLPTQTASAEAAPTVATAAASSPTVLLTQQAFTGLSITMTEAEDSEEALDHSAAVPDEAELCLA